MRVVSAQEMETHREPEAWFTGTVWMDAASVPPPGAGVYRVFFEPAARTHWHSHPEGQILYIVTGKGRVQKWDEPIIEVGPGDIVYIAPDEKHWHGAGPESFMVHIAINPAINTDGTTEWMEEVADHSAS